MERLKWALLLHLGYNMWKEKDALYTDEDPEYTNASDRLLCDAGVWNEITGMMPKYGFDTLVIDLGEGIRYNSHPELAIEGSWTMQRLKTEIHRLRSLGITPIPKLNFSACHDQWLGEYSRCLSTEKYYQVCKDVIEEVFDIFDGPELFHLGMDEETYQNQSHMNYIVIRNGDLWWKDLYFLIDKVEKQNTRAWIWSDHIWDNRVEFLKKMPKSVLQSNWYYGRSFVQNENNRKYIEAYTILDDNGYDQIPTGSNWECPENFTRMVGLCDGNISKEHLKGFLQAPWMPATADRLYYHLGALDIVRRAKQSI